MTWAKRVGASLNDSIKNTNDSDIPTSPSLLVYSLKKIVDKLDIT
jgi:hypothetical protein